MKPIIIKILLVAGFIFLVWFVISTDKKNTKNAKIKVDYLMKNGKFSIGKVTGKTYQSTGNGGPISLTSIMYSYMIDEKLYKADISSFIPKQISEEARRMWGYETNKGDEFLVLYKEEDPKYSILCLDKPVKDSTDLKKYIKEIEKMRSK